jgi:SAM-dependent methyltransferase
MDSPVVQPRPISRSEDTQQPWQLRMFSKTLKKQQKLALLLRQIGDVRGKKCLLVTNGDNNGALNHHFRSHGGDWTWVENEPDTIPEMEQLLGEPVRAGTPERIPVDDASCDVVVTIDVHEHLDDCAPFNRELARVAKPGGTVVVTTPNGDAWKPVVVLKNLVGMTKEKYGHKVIGYNVRQHSRMLAAVGLQPVASGSYSKFFTEMLELGLNFAYVMVLAKKAKAEVKEGTIAPSTGDQLRSVEKQYRAYAAVYPVLWAISKLDALLFFFTGYAVSVVARRPERPA